VPLPCPETGVTLTTAATTGSICPAVLTTTTSRRRPNPRIRSSLEATPPSSNYATVNSPVQGYAQRSDAHQPLRSPCPGAGLWLFLGGASCPTLGVLVEHGFRVVPCLGVDKVSRPLARPPVCLAGSTAPGQLAWHCFAGRVLLPARPCCGLRPGPPPVASRSCRVWVCW